MTDLVSTSSGSGMSSTSTLLKEISTLRIRLKDLEDDSKSAASSAVDDTALVNMLKKDVARVEQEKATMEREFMNTLSKQATEHKVKVDALKEKLSKSEEAFQAKFDHLQNELNESEAAKKQIQADLEASQQNDKGSRYLRLLDEQRESHAEEMEQMKRTLASSDLEIVENRREMDHLQEQLFESHVKEETLTEEIAALQKKVEESSDGSDMRSINTKVAKMTAELREAKNELTRKDEELGEMNDALITLEQQKDELMSEVTDIRLQIQEVESENRELKNGNFTPDGLPRSNMSVDEAEMLEHAVIELEKRLENLSNKLEEKDNKIIFVAEKYDDVKRHNKELRQKIQASGASTPSSCGSIDFFDEEMQRGQDNAKAELDTLRKRNKALSDEVKQLRKNGNVKTPTAAPPRTPIRGRKSPYGKQETPRSPMNSSQPSHSLTRKTASASPGGSISNLVASFERRIAGSGNTPNTSMIVEDDSPPSAPASPQEEQDETGESQSLVNVQRELETEREVVSSLKKELASERQTIDELRRSVEHANAAPNTNKDKSSVESRLEETQQEVDRLVSLVRASEVTEKQLQQDLAKAEAEVKNLRTKVEDMSAEQCTLQEVHECLQAKMQTSEQTVSELREQLHTNETEREELNKIVSENDIALEKLRKELQQSKRNSFEEEKKDEGQHEELDRLRSQISSIQPELDKKMAQVESLQGVVDSLKADFSKKGEDATNVKQLRTELSKLQVEKAGMEIEYTNKINELENELEVVELAAEEELEERENEMDKLKEQLKENEKEITRLEEERTHLCTSMNDVSASRKGELEELRDELMDVTAQSKAQEREIDSLRQKLIGQPVPDSAKSYKKRIRELESELESMKWETRNKLSSDDVDSVREENTRLRTSIRDLKVDRRALNEKLDAVLTERSTSKSAQVLRERNSTLKREVEKLTTRLKKLEDSITRFAI